MTAQVPEILEVRGQCLPLCEEPLYPYLRKLRKDRRPNFVWSSTSCGRGYVGRWSIAEGVLHLIDLAGLIEKTPARPRQARLAEAMPWLKPPVPATWFTGRLRCIEGRLMQYCHQGYASTYERDRFFDIEKGRVMAEWVRLNPPDPIAYYIDPSGVRVCVERLGDPHHTMLDPLGDRDWDAVYDVWGKPPEEEADAYYLGGWLERGVGDSAEPRYQVVLPAEAEPPPPPGPRD